MSTRRPGFVRRVAETLQGASTIWFSGDAEAAAVVDDLVGDRSTCFADCFHQVCSILPGSSLVLVRRRPGDAVDVRVDDHADGLCRTAAQNHVGRFASYTWEPLAVVIVVGDLAAKQQ